jgi:hypothetical protein
MRNRLVGNSSSRYRQPRLDLFADQAAVHGVDVAVHVNDAAGVHPRLHPLVALQSRVRKRLEVLHLRFHALPPAGIQLRQQQPQKLLVFRQRCEIAAAPQQQRLLDRPLQTVMPLFHVAVLVGLARLDLLAVHPVMPQQGLVASGELLLVAHVVHRRR